MGERLRLNGYQKEERLKQREQAIAHNNAERERIMEQAKAGRQMHPSLIAKQADRYREATRQADLAAKQAQEAAKEAHEYQTSLKQLDARQEAKVKELSKLDQDIDRLRAMRDQERGHGLNH